MTSFLKELSSFLFSHTFLTLRQPPEPKAAEPPTKAANAAKAKGQLASITAADADADASTHALTAEKRRSLWMQYLRTRRPGTGKGTVSTEKMPAEMTAKVNANPKKFFHAWLKNGRSWGQVMITERAEDLKLTESHNEK